MFLTKHGVLYFTIDLTFTGFSIGSKTNIKVNYFVNERNNTRIYRKKLKYLFSKHRPSGPMLSISRNVRMFVCVSVCSLLRYRLTVFLPPLHEVGCPIFLEIRNPWGKVMERSGLTFEHFCLEVV